MSRQFHNKIRILAVINDVKLTKRLLVTNISGFFFTERANNFLAQLYQEVTVWIICSKKEAIETPQPIHESTTSHFILDWNKNSNPWTSTLFLSEIPSVIFVCLWSIWTWCVVAFHSTYISENIYKNIFKLLSKFCEF